MVSRRALLGSGLGLAAAAGTSWLSGQAVAGAQTAATARGAIRIGYLPITDAAPLLIAHQRGLYAQAGVPVGNPIRFRSWASLSEAFVVGKVDVIHLLMPMALYMKFDLRADVQITAWNHVNGSALTVRYDIDHLEQLAGETVAIPAWWSIHNVILQKMLRARGLTPVVRETPSAAKGTVALLPMSPADMLPALQNKVIGGYVVADPFNAAAEIKKVGKIHRFLGDVWRDHACCVTVMQGDLIRRRPAEAAAFMEALVQAQLLSRTQRPETAAALAKGYLPQPLPAITRSLTYPTADYAVALQNPGWGGERIDFKPFPFPSFTSELITGMHETVVDTSTSFLHRVDPGTAHTELVNDSLVLRGIGAHGGLDAFGMTGLTRTEEINA